MDKFVKFSYSQNSQSSQNNHKGTNSSKTSLALITMDKKNASEAKKATVSTVSTVSTTSSLQENGSIINVFTDGSCIQSSKNKNNRPAGFSCVFPEFPKFNYSAKLEGEKTNNRAEYTACILALTITDKIDSSQKKILYVYTDSELMINSLTKWMPGWKAKNWKKADGSPVKNIDLLKVLDDLIKNRVVVFKHVRAHTGKKDWASIHNDTADRMAKEAAMS
jgi:ribonuclease HI